MKQITWSPKLVDIKNIKPTPNNYKIKTDLGKERLQQSLKMFGLAGTVVCNTDLSLIDGNSRVEEAKERGEKKIWVSMPNRKLTPKEYQEMAAMYDFAKAGEVDMERIEKELGTKEEFFKKWALEVPMHLLEGMGKGAPVVAGKGKKTEVIDEAPLPVSDIKLVQLFFSAKQAVEFRKWEEKLLKKFKVDNTTDCVYQAFKHLAK